MHLSARAVLAACLISLCGGTLAATDLPNNSGVRAAEDRWSEAFITGDTNTLDALLDPEYVSVNTTGHARTKAEILQLARNYAAAHPGEHAKPLASTSTIRVVGNAAVVQHHGDSDTSVDVFYFRNGHWHAWYSQHSQRKE